MRTHKTTIAVSVILALAATAAAAAPPRPPAVPSVAQGVIDNVLKFVRAEAEDTLPHIGGIPTPPPLPRPQPTPPRTGPPPVELPDGAGPHLPDLASFPAIDVYLDVSDGGAQTPAEGVVSTVTARPRPPLRRAIRFGTAILNVGRHSAELVGIPERRGEEVRVRAEQCVRFAGPRVVRSGRVCQQYTPVGSLSFHAEHGHLHLDEFARYELRRDAGGRPMPGPAGLATKSAKVGFCLGDVAHADHDHPPVIDAGWYRECRYTTPHVPVTIRQGISPGWADVYGSMLPGQYLAVDKVPDGVYWLVITVNAAGQIKETTTRNNASAVRLRLSGGGKHLEVG